LLADNNTEKHARQTVTRAGKLIAGCRFVFMADAQASAAEWLAGERRAERLSIATSNYYLRDTKSFFSWMVSDGRAGTNPLAHLSPLNAEVEDRRQRRALEPDEYRRLLAAAQAGPRRARLSGQDRFILYLVASNAGLRNQELASLTPESFNLDGDDPTVTVRAAYSKHRREDVQQIRADLAELLREHLADKPAGQAVWPGKWWRKAAKMMRGDLKDARHAWIQEAGADAAERQRSDYLAYANAAGEVFDFYAQRGQMLTALEQAGVSLKALQALARHSRVETTLRHYTRRPRLADTRAALDTLPLLPTQDQGIEALRATGTEDVAPVCHRFAQANDSMLPQVRLHGEQEAGERPAPTGSNPLREEVVEAKGDSLSGDERRGPSRIRTGDGGFAIRCLTTWLRGRER
jgi:integrase